MALTHHDATFDHKWRRGKTKLIGTQQGTNQHINGQSSFAHQPEVGYANATGSRLASAVFLTNRVPMSIPACLIDDCGETPVPIKSSDHYVICLGLRNTGCDGAYTHFRNQLN